MFRTPKKGDNICRQERAYGRWWVCEQTTPSLDRRNKPGAHQVAPNLYAEIVKVGLPNSSSKAGITISQGVPREFPIESPRYRDAMQNGIAYV